MNLNDYQAENDVSLKALCHNDLSGSNMLVDPEAYHVLTGIIDFGNARVVSVAEDFFPLYKISRKLALDTLQIYNKIVLHPLTQNQIDGLALRYIGYGLCKNPSEPSPYLMRLLKMF